MDLKIPAQASVHRGEVFISRPSLARRDTQREAQLSPKQFEERWHTGPFADVQDKRLGRVGPRLFTQAHEDLLRRMRLEGSRVSQALAESRREAVLVNERHQETWRKLHKTRDDNHVLRETLHGMQDELREAHVALSELDAMFALTRERRQSRRYDFDKGKAPEDIDRCATPDLHPDRAQA